ncbi:MAG: hypothetical protein R3293_04115 [Candidatus Promineifilaceae bacterium]|nr:hypothetical protein [Candidatus Promineifilaceae bacterium]
MYKSEPPSMNQQREMQQTKASTDRPFGIYVISALLFISAVLLAAGLLVLEFVGDYLPDLEQHALLATALLWLLVALLIVAIVGLLLLKRWGWTLTMIMTGISLAISIWLYFQGTPNYPNMVIYVIIVFYLNQRDVQAPFLKQHETGEQ